MAGRFGNMFNRNKPNNGKDYDVMDPTQLSPNEKAAKKQVIKALKAAAKAVAKIVKAIIKALIQCRTLGMACFSYNNTCFIYSDAYNRL